MFIFFVLLYINLIIIKNLALLFFLINKNLWIYFYNPILLFDLAVNL